MTRFSGAFKSIKCCDTNVSGKTYNRQVVRSAGGSTRCTLAGGVACFGVVPGLISGGRTRVLPCDDLVGCGSPVKTTPIHPQALRHGQAHGPMVDGGLMPEHFKQDDGLPPIPRHPVFQAIQTLCLVFFVNDPHQAVGHQPSRVLVRIPALISAL